MGSYSFIWVFIVILLNLENCEINGNQNSPKEEDLELEGQLKILNKSPIKTIY
ncbi:hypothetical protein MKW94_002259, partial [Papaver nudicaule]|nr:hypothetical protein [Papaver nudicaule]